MSTNAEKLKIIKTPITDQAGSEMSRPVWIFTIALGIVLIALTEYSTSPNTEELIADRVSSSIVTRTADHGWISIHLENRRQYKFSTDPREELGGLASDIHDFVQFEDSVQKFAGSDTINFFRAGKKYSWKIKH